MTNEQIFNFAHPDGFRRLGEVFDKAGYTSTGVARRLGVGDAREFSQQQMPRLLEATAALEPLDVFIRLFLIGSRLPASCVETAVKPMNLTEWVEAGLIAVDGQSVDGQLQILPFADLRVAFDRPQRIKTDEGADYVMGIGSSTLTLSNVTIRRQCSATLDLGCGCGFLAFMASPHSRHVVAVDRNVRAVRLARFNAQLNGLANVECLEGDLFEPVAGRKFDLIVSNPPFVISPETRYIYRDSGMSADEITRKIVSRAPEFLNEGGFCQILFNWAHFQQQAWQERLAVWFDGLGCDAWVMRTDTLEADAYAAKWIRHTERDSDEDFQRRYERWTAYYRQTGIEAVSGGIITMRKRESSTAGWFRADDGPEKMLGPAGEAFAVAFELHDFLDATRDDEQLATARLTISPHAQLRQSCEPVDGGWRPVESQLTLERGLAYTGMVDPYIAKLAAACDGSRTLGELIADMAADLGQESSKIRPHCLEIVRRLIERGFLLPGKP